MRNRKKNKTVAEIKKDPDVRIVFKAADYAKYLEIQALADLYDVNLGVLSKHILFNYSKKFMKCKTKDIQDVYLLPVLQSLHGIEQFDLFDAADLDFSERPLELKTEKKKGSKNVKA